MSLQRSRRLSFECLILSDNASSNSPSQTKKVKCLQILPNIQWWTVMAPVESYWPNTKEPSFLRVCWLTGCQYYCLIYSYIAKICENGFNSTLMANASLHFASLDDVLGITWMGFLVPSMNIGHDSLEISVNPQKTSKGK